MVPMTPRLALLSLAALAACQPGSGQPLNDPEGGSAVTIGDSAVVEAPAAVLGPVVAANVAWGDYLARGDAAGLAGLLAADAVLMLPEGDLTGRETIRSWLERRIAERADTILATETLTETLDVAGDRAYEAGTLVFTMGGRDRSDAAPVRIRARYLTFWQRETGGSGEYWSIRRIYRSHWP